jgi:hypothetical protein
VIQLQNREEDWWFVFSQIDGIGPKTLHKMQTLIRRISEAAVTAAVWGKQDGGHSGRSEKDGFSSVRRKSLFGWQ